MRPRAVLAGHKGPVLAITYSSSPGQYILTSSIDRSIRLYNPSTPAPPPPSSSSSSSHQIPHPPPLHTYSPPTPVTLALAVSRHSSSHFLSAGANDRSVLLWDVATSEIARRFGGHLGRVNAVTFAGHDGTGAAPAAPGRHGLSDSVAISGGQDRTVKLWDLRAGSGRPPGREHSGPSITTSPIMNLTDGRDAISDVKSSGPFIYAASYDGHVRAYDVRMGRCCTDTIGTEPITSIDLAGRSASDSQTALTGPPAYLVGSLGPSNSVPEVRLMHSHSGTLARQFLFPTQTSPVNRSSVAPHLPAAASDIRVRSVFGPADKHVISSAPDGKVYIWNASTGELISQVQHAVSSQPAHVTDIAVCPGNKSTNSQDWDPSWEWCSAGSDGQVVCWAGVA